MHQSKSDIFEGSLASRSVRHQYTMAIESGFEHALQRLNVRDERDQLDVWLQLLQGRGHLLTRVLQRLVEAGHTVIMVEHHRELIQRVDHIIDLGPGGGEAGGLLIGEGTPQHIATLDTPTRLALRLA